MIGKLFRYMSAVVPALFSPMVGNCDGLDQKSLMQIIEALCPNNEGLLKEVLLSAKQPKVYFDQFKDELLERGIEEWKDVDFWLALIDGLQRRNCLIEVDWKNNGRDFAWQLGQLKEREGTKLDWSGLARQGEDYKPSAEFATEIEKILQPKNFSLVFLVFSGDSYALSLVDKKDVERIQNAAVKLSQRIEIFDINAGDK